MGAQAEMGSIMQRRTTLLFALAQSSCLIGEPVGDLPGQGETGADSLDPSSEASGDVGDGHSSDPNDDNDSSATNTDPSADGGEDTGGEPGLCVHEPSGAEPGSIVWQHGLDLYPSDVVALDSGVAVFAEGHVQRWTSDLEQVFDTELSAPESGLVYSLKIVALDDDQIVAAYYDPNGAPEWGAHRWLVGIDGDGAIVWDTFLGEGTFAISATPNGTVAVVGATSMDGLEWETTLMEVDDRGDLIRTVPTDIVGNAPLQGASVGPLGDVAAFGLSDGAAWLAHWTADYDANWSNSTDPPPYALAHAPDGDIVVGRGEGQGYMLERILTPQGELAWQHSLAAYPFDIEVDCDGSIVVAGHDGVSRRDADGTPQWTTFVDDNPVGIDIDRNGNIYALVQEVDSDPSLAKLTGL
jgi:hypothetical protein